MKYSIIIPQKDCADLTKRCISSIPVRKDIEIIVVDDNSKHPESLKEIESVYSDSCYKFIYTTEGKGAGFARNVGLKEATGEWLIFSDADDLFTHDAFDIFDKYSCLGYDYVLFYHTSVYSDTLEPCIRYSIRNKYIDKYLQNPSKDNEDGLKYTDIVPWAKMIKRSIAVNNELTFDEVPASNDVTFVSQIAYHCKRMAAVRECVYILTFRSGSITRVNNKENDYSRFLVSLRFNNFLKDIGCEKLQSRVLSKVLIALHTFGIKEAYMYIKTAHKYNQSLFTGLSFSFESLKDKLLQLFRRDSYQG